MGALAQKFQMVGVVEDGTPRAAGVPVDTRAPLRFPVGATVEIDLTVKTPSGALVNLAGATLTLTARKQPGSSPIFQAKIATLASARGGATFALAPSDTARVAPGTYLFDIWISASGDQQAIVPASPLVLTPRILT